MDVKNMFGYSLRSPRVRRDSVRPVGLEDVRGHSPRTPGRCPGGRSPRTRPKPLRRQGRLAPRSRPETWSSRAKSHRDVGSRLGGPHKRHGFRRLAHQATGDQVGLHPVGVGVPVRHGHHDREAGRSGKVTGPYQVQTVGRVVATDMQLKFWPNKMPGTRDPPAPRREELSRQ